MTSNSWKMRFAVQAGLVVFGLCVPALGAEELPAGAARRLGTTGFWRPDPVVFVASTPDSKHLLAVTAAGAVDLLDAADGRAVRNFLPPRAAAATREGRESERRQVDCRGTDQTVVAVSPDGAWLAAAAFPGDAVGVWELATGRLRKEWRVPGSVNGVAFAPDSTSLFTRHADSVIRQWSADGRELRQFGVAAPAPSGFLLVHPNRVGITATQREIVVVTAYEGFLQAKTVVRRWDAGTGKELAVRSYDGGPLPTTVAPDGAKMAVVNGGANVIIVDAASGKELHRLPGEAAYFAPDGNVAVVSNASAQETTFTTWDLATGQERGRLAAVHVGRFSEHFTAATGSVAPDGRHFVWSAGRRLFRFDLATGKEVSTPAGHRDRVRLAAFARDGRRIVTQGADGRLCLWDAESGRPVADVPLPSKRIYHVRFAADGRSALLAGQGDVSLLDAADFNVRQRWQGHGPLGGVAVTADGRRVATRGEDGSIRIWDAGAGAERARAEDVRVLFPWNGFMQRLGTVGADSDNFGLLFSPDGRHLAAAPPLLNGHQEFYIRLVQLADSYRIHLWDVETGAAVRTFGAMNSFMSAFAGAPDGRTIATAHRDDHVVLWETATGKERGRFKTGASLPVTALAWTPDGGFLVGGGRDGVLRFWEADTGKECQRRPGHRGEITSLAFSADGKTLLSGSADTTTLVWTMPLLEESPRARIILDEQRAEALWADLASDDPRQAWRAVRALADAPAPAAAVLRARLRPVAAPAPEHVQRLIRELDDAQFTVRQQAETALADLGELAVPDLHRALARKPSLEAEQRLRRVMAEAAGAPARPEQVRALRAVAALERAGVPEARELLQALAAGADASQLTRDARAALARLTR